MASELQVNTITEATSGSGITFAKDVIPATPLSHRNMVINGEMLVDQRGTTSSAVTNSTYKIDRFIDMYGNGPVHSVQRVTETPTNLSDFFKYSMKIKQTTASGSATPGTDDYNFLQYTVEGQDCAHLKLGTAQARTFTLSFYVKSTVAGIYSVGINNGAYNRSFSKKYTISSASTWERISLTFTGDTTGTWATDNTVGLSVRWNLGGGTDRTAAEGSWGSGYQDGADGSTGANTFSNTVNAEFHITGVQLELGSVATPFEHRSYADELRRCQRYFYRAVCHNAYQGFLVVSNYASTSARGTFFLPQVMRAVPTFSDSGTFHTTSGVDVPLSDIYMADGGGNPHVSMHVDITGSSAQDSHHLRAKNNAASYFQFSAEF